MFIFSFVEVVRLSLKIDDNRKERIIHSSLIRSSFGISNPKPEIKVVNDILQYASRIHLYTSILMIFRFALLFLCILSKKNDCYNICCWRIIIFFFEFHKRQTYLNTIFCDKIGTYVIIYHSPTFIKQDQKSSRFSTME